MGQEVLTLFEEASREEIRKIDFCALMKRSVFHSLGLAVSVLNLCVAVDPYGVHFHEPWSIVVSYLLVRRRSCWLLYGRAGGSTLGLHRRISRGSQCQGAIGGWVTDSKLKSDKDTNLCCCPYTNRLDVKWLLRAFKKP